MHKKSRARTLSLFLSVCLVFSVVTVVSGEEYAALKGEHSFLSREGYLRSRFLVGASGEGVNNVTQPPKIP